MFLPAMLLRKFMGKIDILHLIDGETTRRLVGGSVDFMICAVFLGIEMRPFRRCCCRSSSPSPPPHSLP